MLLAALGALACGSTTRDPGRPAPWPEASAGTDSGGAGGSPEPAAELQAVPGSIHRLNAAEYRATVTDLLGVTPSTLLPPDNSFDGFDNIAEAQSLSENGLEQYLSAAEDVAAQVFASAELRARVVTCTKQDDAACVASIITNVGLRLFRRPLLDAERAPYLKVYSDMRANGELHDRALQQVLVALLTSAQFVFRMEFPSGTPGTEPIGQYELASRLSYLLWSSAPDDALLDAAKESALTEDEQLNAQVARLWDDPKSERFVMNFAGQWLGARRLVDHQVAPQLFPDWTPAVAVSAADEMYLYFNDFLRNDLDFGDFYSSRKHFMDAPLAKLYGVQLTGSGTEPSVLAGNRQGFLGLVGFLALTSYDHRTSPIQRGKFVLERLLCSPLPPPPPNVPPLMDLPEKNPTTRQYLESLYAIPDCAPCHTLLNPFGIALDRFDAIGRYRETYEDGRPIDENVRMQPNGVFPEGLELLGMAGVAEALTADPRSKACLAQMVYTYGLARIPTAADDRDNVALLSERWQKQPLFIKDLVRQLVLTKPFRFRSDGGLP